MSVITQNRWFVLVVFTWLNFNQSLLWFTFSSVTLEELNTFFPKLSHDDIHILMTWGPWTFFLIPVCIRLLNSKHGLQRSLKIAAGLELCCVAFRTIPVLLSENLRSQSWILILLNAAQMLNGVAGPFVMGCPLLLSAMWFPEEQRATATTVGVVLGNRLNGVVGYLLGPFCYHHLGGVRGLFLTTFVLGLIPAMLIFMCFPALPTEPCSPLALLHTEEQRRSPEPQSSCRSQIGDMSNWRNVVSKGSFWAVVIISGADKGAGTIWHATFQESIGPGSYANISDNTISWMGAVQAACYIVGALSTAILCDNLFKRTGRRNYKMVLLACFGCLAVVQWLFALCLPSFAWKGHPIPEGDPLMLFLLAATGFLSGVGWPCSYELAAELAYPEIDEAWSGNLLVGYMNLFSLVLLFVPSNTFRESANEVMASVSTLCFIGMLGVHEKYNRSQVIHVAKNKPSASLQSQP